MHLQKNSQTFSFYNPLITQMVFDQKKKKTLIPSDIPPPLLACLQKMNKLRHFQQHNQFVLLTHTEWAQKVASLLIKNCSIRSRRVQSTFRPVEASDIWVQMLVKLLSWNCFIFLPTVVWDDSPGHRWSVDSPDHPEHAEPAEMLATFLLSQKLRVVGEHDGDWTADPVRFRDQSSKGYRDFKLDVALIISKLNNLNLCKETLNLSV